jgi:anti-sigma B factor antagonist/stage II sporulation protein AA (anti-sigma F factor antagonist)
MDAFARLETVTSREDDGEVIVRVIGELDMGTAPQLADVLRAAIRSAGAGKIVVDLADLDFIDANGLTVLVDAHRRAGTLGRSLRAREPRGEVDMVLRLTGLAALLQVPDVPVDVGDPGKRS